MEAPGYRLWDREKDKDQRACRCLSASVWDAARSVGHQKGRVLFPERIKVNKLCDANPVRCVRYPSKRTTLSNYFVKPKRAAYTRGGGYIRTRCDLLLLPLQISSTSPGVGHF
jgi:hypothetical protein